MATVFIEAGHGGIDPGAVSFGRKEKDDNLRLASAVGAELAKVGVEVRYARTTDTTVDLNAMARSLAAAKDIDLVVSLHRNSYKKATANGIEVLYRYDGSKRLAECLLAELYQVTTVQERGAKFFSYKGFSGVLIPAAVVELGFITNSGDNERFDNSFYSYAQAIASAILIYLGKERIEVMEERYRTLADVPEWGRGTVERLIKAKALSLPSDGVIDVSRDMVRTWVVLERERGVLFGGK